MGSAFRRNSGEGGRGFIAYLIVLALVMAALHLIDTVRPISSRSRWRIANDSATSPVQYVRHLRAIVLGSAPAKDSPLPRLDLRVPPSEWKRILAALPRGERKWARGCGFRWDDAALRAEVRFGGSTPQHWSGPRKSLRIRFEPGGGWHGIRRLNCNVPETRLFLNDALATRLARRLGLVVAEDTFAHLYQNGVHQGVRFIVEDVDRGLLERNGLGNADLYHEASPVGVRFAAPPAGDPTRIGWKVVYSPDTRAIPLANLLALMDAPEEEFRRKIPRLLDLDRFFRWYVHMQICGSGHQNYHNLVLVYDRGRGRFFFVPWDVSGFGNWAGPERSAHLPPNWATNRLVHRILEIPEFEEEKNRLLASSLRGPLRSEIQRREAETLIRLLREDLRADPGTRVGLAVVSDEEREAAFSDLLVWIDRRTRFLESALAEATVAIHPHPVGRGLVVRAGGWSGARLRIPLAPEGGRAEVFMDLDGDGTRDRGEALLPLEPGGKAAEIVLLPGRKARHRQTILSGRAAHDENFGYGWQSEPAPRAYCIGILHARAGEISAENSVTGARVVVRRDPAPAPGPFAAPVPPEAPPIPAPSAPLLAPHIDFSRAETAVVPPGTYRIPRLVRVPKGKTLVISAGTTLLLDANASLLVEGRILALGAPASEILVRPTFDGEAWGSVAVFGRAAAGLFRHVRFESGGQAMLDGRLHSAALSIQGGRAEIDSCRFEGSTGEDAVNVDGAEVEISRTVVARSAADGIDLDFCRARIRETRSEHNGGDGIDLGSASAEIRSSTCRGNVDKGISVGESSTTVVSDVLLQGNGIGCAVKDGSVARFDRTTFLDNGIGLALYREREAYGAPSAEAVQCAWSGEGLPVRDEAAHPAHVRNSLLARPVYRWTEAVSSGNRVAGAEFSSPARGDWRLAGPPRARPGITDVHPSVPR